jgi:hypothetical protein
MDLFGKFDTTKNFTVPITSTDFLSVQDYSVADYSERLCLCQSSSKTGEMPACMWKFENSIGKNIKMVKRH